MESGPQLRRANSSTGVIRNRDVAVVLALTLAGCSSAHGNDPSCSASGTVRQALVNGATQEIYLGIGQSQINAVVQVVDMMQPDVLLCSGTFVAPGWVVTARHCLQTQNLGVVLQQGPQGPQIVIAISGTVGHPTLDIALLAIGATSADASLGTMTPIPPAAAAGRPPSVGDVVELAGYGLTETGAATGLHFLDEEVVSLDQGSITVSGFGASGACRGDSGGPLLIRGTAGNTVVLGVLSLGSSTCRQDDTFTRLDSIQGWLQGITGPSAPTDLDCGTIGPEGRCLYGNALWCDASRLAAEACSAGTRCGWDQTAWGFRCVNPSTDPCLGADSFGVCHGNATRTCIRGVLLDADCAPCEACRIDGKSGTPLCASGP